MARSVRWKLLAWYSLILTCLALVFGVLLYVNVRRSLERDADFQLRTQASALARVVVPTGYEKFAVELTPELVEQFGAEGSQAAYYSIWRADGTPVDSSHPELDIPFPATLGSRDRGDDRELTIAGPGNTRMLVGIDIGDDLQQLRGHVAIALAVGMASLGLMLVGGWFLTGRALAPIERISQAAATVSASNLSERIDISRMETELADLATTINDAFDRLQLAFEQQTRFTADASHELRTPLAIVLSHADHALSRDRSEADYRETLATIRRAAARMKGVVEGLLTLARADAGRVQIANERVDLHRLVDETCGMFDQLAADRGITLRRELAPASVMGDRDRLGEVVANLISNALQYNHPGGSVDVTLHREGPTAIVRVADTGPGIPAADQPHIFERFYRVDKARSRSVDGTGLGLSITKWIVEAHGGSIAYESGSASGAVFVVRLNGCTEPTSTAAGGDPKASPANCSAGTADEPTLRNS